MLIIARTFIILIAAAISTHASAAGCEPGPNEVTLYQHGDYRGSCSVLGLGYYQDAAAMRMKNDSVSSIKVGANVEIVVSKHSFRGNTGAYKKRFMKYTGNVEEVITSSQSSLKRTRVGNDSISSVGVRLKKEVKVFEPGDCYPGDNSNSIALYQHPGFKGNCRLLDLGSYKNSTEMNFKNDSVSSIEFGRNSKVYVELYADSDFKGRTQTLSNSLEKMSYGGAIADNDLTSIKVLQK